eukprot:Protomagalhaensia_sp_Gyna_25__5468@NODE_721_length_2768_cov_297_113595_g561_i0_p1_GENE_NODE_721_length_2768_cov_297_113595_g561_i0NODE_721_length_2768_cov_297_113595_g561_i0_p1_ORF_typecomplete_len535_score47_70Rhomboid/PF01694_22/1e04Rhomboid/PF01694_22/2_4e26Rhomboid/PF01694_22/3_9e03DUF1751/PF08551_10/0_003DUF1751/PF08551_10/2_5e03_NODE_721_length_2768_cov_297_113595_g561_i010762680
MLKVVLDLHERQLCRSVGSRSHGTRSRLNVCDSGLSAGCTFHRGSHVFFSRMNDPFEEPVPPPKIICYVPYDPASRNVPLRGKICFTQAVFWVSSALLIASLVIGDGFTNLHNNPMLGPSIDDITTLGGMSQQLVRDGAWWRIIWASVLHAGVLHYFMNMAVWYKLGSSLEPDWGFFRTCIVFLIAAFTGNLLSVTLDPINVSIGTSGGIFGLLSGTIVYVIEYWDTIPERRLLLIVSIASVVVGIATSFMPFVDVYAHMGGALGGLLGAGATISRSRLFASSSTVKETVTEDSVFRPMVRDCVSPDTAPPAILKHHASKSLSTVSSCSPTPLRPASSISRRPLSGVKRRVSERQALEQVCVDSRTPVSFENQLPPPPAPVSTHTALLSPFTTWQTEALAKTKPVRFRLCKRKRPPPSHFAWLCDSTLTTDRSRSLRLGGATKVVLNPAARRSSLRRTRLLVDKGFDLKSLRLWALRGACVVLLSIMWVTLFFFLWICPECYEAPGQILQMKELRAANNRRRLGWGGRRSRLLM